MTRGRWFEQSNVDGEAATGTFVRPPLVLTVHIIIISTLIVVAEVINIICLIVIIIVIEINGV